MTKLTILLSAIVLIAFTGCTVGQSTPTVNLAEVVQTSVAQTVQVVSTKIVASLPVPTVRPSDTPEPAVDVTVLPTLPTEAIGRTIVPGGQFTGFCDSATFVGDITIPDMVSIPPGSNFKKIWAIKNNGQCTWTTDYKVVFVSGDPMNAPSETALANPVAPGEMVLISVTMTAPQEMKKYNAFFKLRNATGGLFGMGPNADRSFYALINVDDKYSFTDNMCSAKWTNATDLLYCPSKEGDSKGYAIVVHGLKNEVGLSRSDPAIVMSPQSVTDGEISGKFNPIVIPPDAHLKTVTGCLYGATNCNVIMGITYSIDGGPDQLFDNINERQDGQSTELDYPLNNYSGKSISFTFFVKANGGADDDRVFFLYPRIVPVH